MPGLIIRQWTKSYEWDMVVEAMFIHLKNWLLLRVPWMNVFFFKAARTNKYTVSLLGISLLAIPPNGGNLMTPCLKGGFKPHLKKNRQMESSSQVRVKINLKNGNQRNHHLEWGCEISPQWTPLVFSAISRGFRWVDISFLGGSTGVSSRRLPTSLGRPNSSFKPVMPS